MKAVSLFQVVSLALICTVSGCKSPTAVVSNAPYVTITPSNFHGAEFVVDTFQAQIFNHDFAQTYFTWDMGDSSNIPSYFETYHSYSKPGNYTITVNAFDIYSKSVIATAHTSVLVDTVRSSVEITPQFYNGVLPTNTFGQLSPFSLSVITTIPDNYLYQFWDYGDGMKDSYLSGTTTHVFPQSGTYIVKVDVYQKNGIYVGTDTAAITVSCLILILQILSKPEESRYS